MFSLVVLVCLFNSVLSDGDTALLGHLQRLGLQRKSEGHIDILKDLPSPSEFFHKYVKPGRPAVFKGAAKPMPAFQNWNDEYLRTKFADLRFDVEEGKKENRSLRSFVYSMKDFVDKYKTEDVYMVHSIQKEMREDVTLLPTVSCGGYMNLLQDIVMWFSSGGTSSVLHSDNVDNINCLFSGHKELYMVDKIYGEHVVFDSPHGHSNVDPDAVDLKKYPGLAKAPWWEAKMEPGDCLFIPVSWFHQVRSYDRNIAVNVWFSHPHRINESNCEGKDWKNQYVPLINYKLKSNQGAKQMIELEIKARGKLNKKQFIAFLNENLQTDARQIKQVFVLVDKNKDNSITMEDINALSEDDLVFIRQLMPMGAEYGDESDSQAGAEDGFTSGDENMPEDSFEDDKYSEEEVDNNQPISGDAMDADDENKDSMHNEL